MPSRETTSRLRFAMHLTAVLLLGPLWLIAAGGCHGLSQAAGTDLSRRPVSETNIPTEAVAAPPREIMLDRIGRIRLVGTLRPAVGTGRSAVICNGLDVDVAGLEAIASTLAAAGFSTIAYRWEGDTHVPATPAADALLDAALAAADALRTQPGVDGGRICMVGRGVGGAVALAASLEMERRGQPAAGVVTIDLVDPREAGWEAAATNVGFPLLSGLVGATVSIGGVPRILDPVATAAHLRTPTLHIATPGATEASPSRVLRAWRASAGPSNLWFTADVEALRLFAPDAPAAAYLLRFSDGTPPSIDWSWSHRGTPWASRIEVTVRNGTDANVRVQINAIAGGQPILEAFREAPAGTSVFTSALPRQPTDVTVVAWP